MQNTDHFKGPKGYAQLYLLIAVIGIFISLFVMLFARLLKMPNFGLFSATLILLAIFVGGILASRRFLSIETRRANLYEANQIAVCALLYILGFILIIALIGLVFSLINIAFNGLPSGGEKKELSRFQILSMFSGIFGTSLYLYIVPLLSFGVFSKMMAIPAHDNPETH